MRIGVSPSRLRFFAVAVAVLACSSGIAAVSLIGFSSPSAASIHGWGNHSSLRPSVGVDRAPAGPVAGSFGKAAVSPAGGIEFNFGVVATVSLPAGAIPVGVAADNVTGNVYVTDSHFDRVWEINGATDAVTSIAHVGANGSSPSGLVYDYANSDIYVANFSTDGGGNVKILSAATGALVTTIALPGGPVGLAYDSLNGDVWVTDQYTNSVSELSGAATPTLVETLRVGDLPIALSFDPVNQTLYVANAGSANVSVVNTTTNTVMGAVPAGAYPIGVTYDSVSHDVYVTNWHSNNTTVISGLKSVGSVPVDAFPLGVAYDLVHSVVGVVSEKERTVDFISTTTNTVIGNVSVGSMPVGIAYDRVTDYEYVTNGNSSNVSVIGTAVAPPYAATFTETGLPSGTSWTVSVDSGTPLSSTTTSLVFSGTNGSYTYQVGAIAGYSVSPSSGGFTVKGFPLTIPLVFSAISYRVTFTENGLPAGTLWSATLGSTPEKATTPTIEFNETNGTYPFAASSASSSYTAGPSSGNITVRGAAVFQTITFTAVGVSTYLVTFTEIGLPTGTTWTVVLNNSAQSSTSTTVNFTEPKGAYPYTVQPVTGYNATPSSGTVTVNGPTGVPITFSTGPGTTTTTSSTPGTPWWVYALVAVIIAVVLIGVVLFLRRRQPPAKSTPPATTSSGPNSPQ